jgi:drug/metabolite transporter (DMT)-like permease
MLLVLAPKEGTSFPGLLFERSTKGPGPTGGSTWVALASGGCNAIGYGFFLTLVKLDGVAVWSAMIGLYAIAPCVFFMIRRGESGGKRKLIGIAACCAAAALLGMGKGEGPPLAGAADSATPLWLKLSLLLGVIASWGTSDSCQALASQDGSTLFVAGWAGIGFAGVGLASLSLSWLFSIIAVDEFTPAYAPRALCMNGMVSAALVNASSAAGGGVTQGMEQVVASVSLACAPPLGQRFGAIALIAVAQAVAMCAWYGVCKLSAMSEASSFMPIISLYTMLTSLASVVFLGEQLNNLGWAGMVLGGCGILLVGGA